MKPRSDSKLMSLPEEQTQKICDWLLAGVPYHQVKESIKKEFEISTSFAALSKFYHTFCAPELIARRRRAVTTADEIAAEASKMPGKFDAATIDALKQKAFELSISPSSTPGEVKALFMLVLKAKDQEISEKQLALDQGRFEVLICEKYLLFFKDDRARKIAESTSSNSEKIAALRQAFFADVDAMEKSGEVHLPK